MVAFSSIMLHPAFAENSFLRQGSEYPIAGLLQGDQVFPHASFNASGGYIVWHDNATDGDGFGVSARRLKSDLLGNLSVFRVNEIGAGDQQNAKVTLLPAGGAVFVWQGGPQGAQDIYARFIRADGTFSTGDQRVNTFTAGQQMSPAVAVGSDGNLIIVWSSFEQDGHLLGIFGQWLSPSGEKIGGEFQVNQHTAANQRTPAVAALGNGRVAVAWVSERQRGEETVDIYARVLGGGRDGLKNEFLVNTTTNLCANPALAATGEGRFLAAWSEFPTAPEIEKNWDVHVRSFDASGAPTSAVLRANAHEAGDQYAPQVAVIGDDYLVVWTSAYQDGSREGVYGRFLTSGLLATSAEFQVNGSTPSQQIHPAVATDGAGQFLAVWTSFVGGRTSFDLLAQRYAPAPVRPAAPFVTALSSSRLSITWPDAGNSGVTAYELYVSDQQEPVVVTGNMWTVGGLAPSSTHSFRLAYQYSNGGRSALSGTASGTTWGSDENLDGLPDDWQTAHWGNEAARWPDPKADSDGDQATNLQEFLAGTDPSEAASVLRTSLLSTEQGTFLSWNTRPGFIYQVESKTQIDEEWTDVGAPRFAAGATDSMLVGGGSGEAIYYRVKRLR